MNKITDVIGAGGGGGGKGGGGDTHVFHEDPNSLRSKSIAKIIDLLCEGEIGGLVNGGKSIFLDNTVLQNEDDSYNFSGVSWLSRNGTPAQDYIPGFSSVENEASVGVEVTNSASVTRTIVGDNLDAVRVKIRIPQLTRSDTTNGDLYGTSVRVTIDLKPNGGSFVQVKDDTIQGKNVVPYEREYRIELPAGGSPWDIRVNRLTADSAVASLVNKTYWSSYASIIDAKVQYVDSALVGLTVDAEKFGTSVPARAYEIYGLIIKVPSNYDAETRVYTGIWDGTFQLAYSNNPAWVMYDILTNTRYGLGGKIDAVQVDKWALYTIGQYCDEYVDDGFGSTEPRFTFNGVLNSRQEAYSVINAIASAFRGMVYWGSGAITATQDSPADATKLVTPANIIDGSFSYSGSALKARHTAAVVTWNDPDDGYRASVEVVEDVAAINSLGWRQIDVVAFGCTSRGQARRYGKWLLDSEQNATELVTYKASFDHADLRPGEIISVADPDYAGARMGGRIVSATSTQIVVDAVPSFSDSATDSIIVVLPDGSIETKEISSIVGSTITIFGSFSQTPQANALWIISTAAVEPRKFRVLSVAEVQNNIFEVTAILHDTTKYARVEQNIQFDTGSFTLVKTGPLPTITEIGVQEYLYLAGSTPKSAAIISYTPPSDARAYLFESEVLRPGEVVYRPIDITQETSVKIEDTVAGIYYIRVRSLSAFGLRSSWFVRDFNLSGLLAPPTNVTTLTLKLNNSQLLLEWTGVSDLDLAGYNIHFNSITNGDATWENSQVLVANVSKNLTSISLPARTGTYLIKAIDTSGIESASAAIAIQTASGVLDFNVVQDFSDETAWSGIFTDTLKVGSYVQLQSSDTMDDWTFLDDVLSLYYGVSGVKPLGYYKSSNTLDLGAKFPVRILGEFVSIAEDLLNVMESWTSLLSLTTIDMSNISEWAVSLEIRTTDDNPVGSPVWSDWSNLIIGEYSARAFQVRAKLESFIPSVTPKLVSLRVLYDMPDRIFDQQDQICVAAGQRFTFTPAFKARPTLAINPESLATGDYYNLSNQDETGFDIRFFNAAGTGVQRTFDFFAKGYGLQL